MISNKGLIFQKTPSGWPHPGEHLAVETREFDLDAPAPKDAITVKNFYVSFDPYQRGGMRDPDTESYFPPYIQGQPIWNHTLSKVLKSDTPDFAPGDLVVGVFGTEEYSAVPAFLIPMARKLSNPYNLPPRLYVGALGISGLAAYASLYEFGKPQNGQVIFISAASGAVGQIVGQLAKLEGLTVLGSVGSDAKLSFITDELGFDGGFNYKKENPSDALARLAPRGLDIYYDNVGGEQLDAALAAMKDFGRIVSSGAISQYNLPQAEKYGVKNMMLLFLKRLTMQGFIVSDPQIISKYMVEFLTNMSKYIAEGKVKTKECVTVGMDGAVEGFLGMLKGENFGKAVLRVAEMEE